MKTVLSFLRMVIVEVAETGMIDRAMLKDILSALQSYNNYAENIWARS